MSADRCGCGRPPGCCVRRSVLGELEHAAADPLTLTLVARPHRERLLVRLRRRLVDLAWRWFCA